VLLLLALWGLVLVLLWAVVRGPERWHRSVTLNLRPDAARPTRSGMALLFWRHLVLLVVVGALALALTREELGPSDEDLVERTRLVADLVPSVDLDADRLQAELVLLEGAVVAVDDVSTRIAEPPADDPATATTDYLQVRSLSVRERLGSVSGDGRDPAACVVVDTTTYPGTDLDPSVLVSVTEGVCAAAD